MIVRRTPKLPVSSRRLSSLKTVSISIGFGATRSPPPNDVRWLHRQRRRCLVDWGPICNVTGREYNCLCWSVQSALRFRYTICHIFNSISAFCTGTLLNHSDPFPFGMIALLVARTLRTKAQEISPRSTENVSMFLYFMASTWTQKAELSVNFVES